MDPSRLTVVEVTGNAVYGWDITINGVKIPGIVKVTAERDGPDGLRVNLALEPDVLDWRMTSDNADTFIQEQQRVAREQQAAQNNAEQEAVEPIVEPEEEEENGTEYLDRRINSKP